uniref:Uncharacterized protein n=1 Tax=Rhizophora mucronata TaxID=61149 RepID=A0A2P2J8B9_RHIMU
MSPLLRSRQHLVIATCVISLRIVSTSSKYFHIFLSELPVGNFEDWFVRRNCRIKHFFLCFRLCLD